MKRLTAKDRLYLEWLVGADIYPSGAARAKFNASFQTYLGIQDGRQCRNCSRVISSPGAKCRTCGYKRSKA